ncbi:MAG: hypothetical protein K2M94_08405 [Paramuribaculum sp.]|nr:hypothetical protein [Paramuribaculum sp.]
MALSRKIKTFIYGFFAVVLLAYLVVSLCVVSRVASESRCTGVLVTVHDTARLNFVGFDDVVAELGSFPGKARKMLLSEINVDSIESYLKSFDKIEDANVTLLTTGKVHVEVWPMRPVMRVFNQSGMSYYLNRQGKKMVADPRYYIDVPVVTGAFKGVDSIVPFILPLLEYIEADSLWRYAIDGVKVNSVSEVLLIPAIHGHVVNFGSPDDMDNKFRRIKSFYTKVMPRKGWNYYDTVTVKWGGQIVATRREKLTDAIDFTGTVDINEIDDVETMSAGSDIQPGQALPDKPAVSEKPVPGAINLQKNN